MSNAGDAAILPLRLTTLPDITIRDYLKRVRVQGMGDYTLTVWSEGADLPIDTVRLSESAMVLDAISALLEKHPGCHRIHVNAGTARLFSVDCAGNNVAG